MGLFAVLAFGERTWVAGVCRKVWLGKGDSQASKVHAFTHTVLPACSCDTGISRGAMYNF